MPQHVLECMWQNMRLEFFNETLFCNLQYDRNQSGALEIEELHAVLADLGILVRMQNYSKESCCAFRMPRIFFC